MKILHTSDWHLGRSLYGRKRYDEFSGFLDWLSSTIEDQNIDILLVAGDIFDTSTPSNRAQELYYKFLFKVSMSCCHHVVVIGGNHDSPSFLNAPKDLLKALNVYVVGEKTENPEDEVIVLKDKNKKAKAIVCAVPYLRDRDIRTVEAGETLDDKNSKLIDGLQLHYKEVCDVAENYKKDLLKSDKPDLPIIGMGHLFTAGGKTSDGDGVRDLYVGSLAHIRKELFPESINYFALGHLHVPQIVGGEEHIRYCGSPIPMGFGEAKQQKKVIVVEFKGSSPSIYEIHVPVFQALVRILGSLDDIHSRIEELKQEGSNAWLEIEYTGSDVTSNLRDVIEEALEGSNMEVRRIKNSRLMDRIINTVREDETLDDLNESDIFERCLDSFEIPQDSRAELLNSYNEIIHSLNTEDTQAN